MSDEIVQIFRRAAAQLRIGGLASDEIAMALLTVGLEATEAAGLKLNQSLKSRLERIETRIH